jgi:hypothetical protein
MFQAIFMLAASPSSVVRAAVASCRGACARASVRPSAVVVARADRGRVHREVLA